MREDSGFYGRIIADNELASRFWDKSRADQLRERVRDGYNGGTGEKTAKMNRLNDEINKRVAKEWENAPRRNRDPNFRWTDANRWDKD